MFTGTLAQQIANFRDMISQTIVGNTIFPVFDRMTSVPLTTAGLAIKTGGSAIVKTGAAACHVLANGILRSVAASTDMPALAGTVANATFNCFAFFIDQAGTVTSQMGIAGATLATMRLPPLPQNKALLGFVIVNPTGTGGFVGGTTPLDDATVVPNAVYINAMSGFDPQCLTGPARS